MMLKKGRTGGKAMQIVVLDAKTLKMEELDLSSGCGERTWF